LLETDILEEVLRNDTLNFSHDTVVIMGEGKVAPVLNEVPHHEYVYTA